MVKIQKLREGQLARRPCPNPVPVVVLVVVGR
jgi:hypothetical protein